jgi:HEAT repeat protein
VVSRKLEDRIDRLRQMRTGSADPEVIPLLRKALSDRSNLVVAEAARTAAELRLSSLIPDLAAAFERLLGDPPRSDPKCWGKTAVVKALVQLDYSQSSPFVRGAHHVQMEPVWGGQEDTAAGLRAKCFLALVQCSDLTRFEVLRHLIDAVSDPAEGVRADAVRALQQVGGDESILLLRMKARLGDPHGLIIGHVFDALLSLEQDRGIAFVTEYLNSANPGLRDEAALALGASRLAGAINVLVEAWKGTRDAEFAGILLRAISSSRHGDGIHFLLALVKTGTPAQVAAALDALKLHKDSPEIQALVDQAVAAR